jgi:hypothetical protein
MHLTYFMRRAALAGATLAACVTQAAAQDPMAGMNMPRSGDTASMAGPLGISMERMGSGTTWIPDAVRLPARHLTLGEWTGMLHGFVFLQYDRQDGPRGADQFGSLNWGMLMGSRRIGAGWLQLRTMLSLDPATVTGRGYPLLLQSGETYRGVPLRDRQHPHDFFMEVAALYERPVAQDLAISLYVAPSGEPAVGPVAFMHRPSAMDDPVAPIGHHWQDATHITYGVITAGLFSRRWKFEGSVFTGREPDERRWNFDRIRLDSYSIRYTFNPSVHWSFSAGYADLESPEVAHPENVQRLVASMLHGRSVGQFGQWASAIVYGTNLLAEHRRSHSALLESEIVLDPRNTIFARAEAVQKSSEELGLAAPFEPLALHGVGHVSLGYIREIAGLRGATLGLGARGTINIVPAALEPVYGSRTPLGGLVFLRVRPVLTRAGVHPGMMHGTLTAKPRGLARSGGPL